MVAGRFEVLDSKLSPIWKERRSSRILVLQRGLVDRLHYMDILAFLAGDDRGNNDRNHNGCDGKSSDVALYE